MASPSDFYRSGLGDRFLDSRFYSGEMNGFLKAEEDLVSSLSDAFDAIVEVGCMEGRYLTWAVRQSKNYTGVDIVPKYIETGCQRIRTLRLCRKTYRFQLGSAEDRATLINAQPPGIARERCLLLFPFNSFGNIPTEERLVANLSFCGVPFLISTYDTSELATQARSAYYGRCGYAGLEIQKVETGICISGSEGIRSMAYYPAYLHSILGRYGLAYATVPLARIGFGYATARIVKRLGKRCLAAGMIVAESTPHKHIETFEIRSDAGEICRA